MAAMSLQRISILFTSLSNDTNDCRDLITWGCIRDIVYHSTMVMTFINCLVAHVAHIHGAQRDRNLNFRISVVYGTVVRPQAQDVGRARVSLRGSTATQVAKSSGHGIVHCEKNLLHPCCCCHSQKLPQKLADASSPSHYPV